MSNFCLRLAVVSTLGMLAACAQPVSLPDDGRPVVLTTFTVIADMARVVGGDDVHVESLIEAGAEIHGYEPTSRALRAAAEADLILDNGLGLESWFSRFVDQIDVDHVVLSEGVDPIPISEGAYKGAHNPHAWMSPLAAQIYVDNIADALADLDPAHATDYRRRAEDYKGELQAIYEELRDAVTKLPPAQRALVTCEGAFVYLARDIGLTQHYLWPTNGENEGTPLQIAGSIKFVRRNHVPAVFCESTVNSAAQEQVSKETGVPLVGKLYVDSLSKPGGDVPTYLDLLRYDKDLIVKGLSR